MKIAVWGFGTPVIIMSKAFIDEGIEVAYVVIDYMRDEQTYNHFQNELNKLGVSILPEPDFNVDLSFIINYARLIKGVDLEKHVFINLHIGLLPKWRGMNANGWAIINGENEVGYTVHRINHLLDDGDIYYKFEYPYKLGETYKNAKSAMEDDMIETVPKLMKNIDFYKPNKISNEQKFVYCPKFRRTDGVISSWEVESEILIRKHYVFGKPLGTGLKFTYKEDTFEISKISYIDKFEKVIGVEGSVVNIVGNSLWVKTLDTAVSLDEIILKGEKIDVLKYFKIGNRL